MPRPVFLSVLIALSLAACGGGSEPADAPAGPAPQQEAADPPESAEPAPPQTEEERQRLAALEEALATMDELVFTLEGIGEDPIVAWNSAEKVSTLMRRLEARRTEFALGMSQEEAAERYPAQVRQLRQLTARLEAVLAQIEEQPIVSQVLWEEVAKADAAADSAATGSAQAP